jgi:hypothetical protein
MKVSTTEANVRMTIVIFPVHERGMIFFLWRKVRKIAKQSERSERIYISGSASGRFQGALKPWHAAYELAYQRAERIVALTRNDVIWEILKRRPTAPTARDSP